MYSYNIRLFYIFEDLRPLFRLPLNVKKAEEIVTEISGIFTELIDLGDLLKAFYCRPILMSMNHGVRHYIEFRNSIEVFLVPGSVLFSELARGRGHANSRLELALLEQFDNFLVVTILSCTTKQTL